MPRRRRRWWHRTRPDPCAQIAQLLQPFLDRELDDEALSVVERHLEDCRRCGLELETYLDMRRTLEAHLRPSNEVLERLRTFSKELADESPR